MSRDMIENLLDESQSNKLKQNSSNIEKLVSSSDGAKVSSILNESGAAEALQRGDTAARKNTFESILKTDEGSRLFRQLSEMLK